MAEGASLCPFLTVTGKEGGGNCAAASGGPAKPPLALRTPRLVRRGAEWLVGGTGPKPRATRMEARRGTWASGCPRSRGQDTPRTRRRGLSGADGAVPSPPAPGAQALSAHAHPCPSALKTRLNPGSGAGLPSVSLPPSAVAPLRGGQPARPHCLRRLRSNRAPRPPGACPDGPQHERLREERTDRTSLRQGKSSRPVASRRPAPCPGLEATERS